MAYQDPFADLPVAGQAPPQQPLPEMTYIPGPPRQAPLHTEQTGPERRIDEGRAGAAAYDARTAAAAAAKAEADAAAAAATAARGGLTAEDANSRNQRMARLRSATNRFLDLATTYQGQYENDDYLLSLPDGLSPSNQAFNATAQAAAADLFAIARVPGVGSQSDREMQAFNDAYLLSAQNSDAANEQRLNSIQNFLNEQRAAADLPPVDWRSNGTPGPITQAIGATAQNVGQAVTGATGGQPSPSGPPANPGMPPPSTNMGQVGNVPGIGVQNSGRMEVSNDGQQFTGDPRMAALANQVNAAYMAGRPASELIRMLEAELGRDGVSAETRSSIRRNDNPGARERWRRRGGNVMDPAWYGDNQGDNLSAVGAAASGSTSPAGAAFTGAVDTALFSGLDEGVGAINGLGSVLQGGTFAEGYDPAVDEFRAGRSAMQENQPLAYGAGQVAGAVALPWNRFAPLGMQAIRGSLYGAGYGFGSGDGSFRDRMDSADAGGAIGLVAPPAIAGVGAAGRSVGQYLRGRPNIAPGGQEIARAAQEEGVAISRPIVDPTARDRMAYLESSRGTGNRIRGGLQETREGIEERAGQLGARGTVEETGTMGQRIQDAGQRYINESRDQRTRLYGRAAQMAGNAQIYGREAVEEIDNQIANLSRNESSNAGEIAFLRSLRSDFVEDGGELAMTGTQAAERGSILEGQAVPRLATLRPKTVADIRDLRTGLRGRINEAGLTYGQAEARVLAVLDRARNDITRDLNATNPRAVRAYARADSFNRERANEIRQIVSRVIGRRDDNLSGEQVMARVRTMASDRGNSDGLSRLWSHLSREEALDAAATIAATAGRKTAEEGFEPGQFVAWARTLSPAARRTIFGPDGAQSIANLRVLSRALMDTTSRLNNSRSGMVANWNASLRDLLRGGPLGIGAGLVSGGSLMLSGAAGLALGAATTGAGIVGRRMSARSLMSPDMSRWLAAAPRATTPSAIQRHIARLQGVAQRDPAIAQEALGLRTALMRAMNDNIPQSGRLAASPNEGPGYE